MVTHHIVAREKVWVVHGLTLEPDDDKFSFRDKDYSMTKSVGEVEIDESVNGPNSAYYECTCGAEFDDFDDAEDHLIDIAESANGEAVTAP